MTSEKKTALRINDLFVLSEGDLPDWVQVWQPTEEKADILFLSTHPDDELIFFGGAIPTYAVEQQRKVVVAYFTRSNTTRSSELLNGLWHMGVRTISRTAMPKISKQPINLRAAKAKSTNGLWGCIGSTNRKSL